MISITGVTTVSENVSKTLTGRDTKDAAEHSSPSAPITVPQGSIPSSDLLKRLSSPCQIIGDIGEAIVRSVFELYNLTDALVRTPTLVF